MSEIDLENITKFHIMPAKVINKDEEGWTMNVCVAKDYSEMRLFERKNTFGGNSIALKEFDIGDYLLIGIRIGSGFQIIDYVKCTKDELKGFGVYSKKLE
jgi:hypothetical protein